MLAFILVYFMSKLRSFVFEITFDDARFFYIFEFKVNDIGCRWQDNFPIVILIHQSVFESQ